MALVAVARLLLAVRAVRVAVALVVWQDYLRGVTRLSQTADRAAAVLWGTPLAVRALAV
jgi:hypothetical protein